MNKTLKLFISLLPFCLCLTSARANITCSINQLVTNVSEKNIQLILSNGEQVIVNQRIDAGEQVVLNYNVVFHSDKSGSSCPSSTIFTALYYNKTRGIFLDIPDMTQWSILFSLYSDDVFLVDSAGLETNKSYIIKR